MWAFGCRAAAGLLPRTASRASAWVGNPRGREPIGTCGRRGLRVTANASAIGHAVSTRAAGRNTGAQAAPAPWAGDALRARAGPHWSYARAGAGHARCLRGLRTLAAGGERK